MEAFCKDEETKRKYKDVGLVIKVSEAELSADDENIISSVIDKDDNIYCVCADRLTRQRSTHFSVDVDVYVSLHRSEALSDLPWQRLRILEHRL